MSDAKHITGHYREVTVSPSSLSIKSRRGANPPAQMRTAPQGDGISDQKDYIPLSTDPPASTPRASGGDEVVKTDNPPATPSPPPTTPKK